MLINVFAALEEHTALSDKTRELLTRHITRESYKQGQFFLKKGESLSKAGFIVSGVFRFYYVDDKGEDMTTLFLQQNNFITKLASYYQNKPSNRYIQAVRDCEILVLSKESHLEISELIPEFDMALSIITTKFLNSVNSFQRKIIDLESEEKYIEYLKFFPDLENKVPLSQVASFIGMTQSTLSRVRKKIQVK